MKSSAKRLLSVLIVLAMALSLLPVMAFAADNTTTVYCQAPSGWSKCKAYWWGSKTGSNPSWPGVDMTKDEQGLWTYDVPSDATGLIFNNGSGTQTSDLKVPTDDKIMYVFSNRTWIPYSPPVPIEEAYYVAGSAGLCGVEWDPGAAANKMTKGSDGIYTITYTGVAAGNYEFKVTDGTWDNSWGPNGGNANYKLAVPEADTTVEILFNSETKQIEVILNDIHTEPTSSETIEGAYFVAGTMNSWNAKDGAFAMTEADGIYTITFVVAAGDHGLKVTNGTWDQSWGGDGPDGNYVFSTTAEGNVTVTFDGTTVSVTGDYIVEKEKTELVINSIHAVGAAGLCGADWDPTANEMTGIDGIYTITFENVEAGTYEFKFAANGTWDLNWASGIAMESGVVCDAWFNAMGNSSVTIPADGATVTLTLDLSAMDAYTGEGGKCAIAIEGVEPGPAPEPTPATYYVAGSFNEWNCAAEGYLMTDNGDGTYTLVLNLTAGAYALKVTNGTWDQSWGGTGADGNYEFTIAEDRAVTVTFDGTTVSVDGDVLPELPKEYCLVGYINGANYGCEEDWENVGEYLFVNGTLTATFTADSYIFVKSTDNANWYLTEAYTEETSATFIKNAGEKMKVPANVELTFTLVENEDGTLTVSYSAASAPAGVTINGAVVTGADGDATIELLNGEEVVATATASGKNGNYTLENVAAGTYTLKVSKLNHVTREYTITVEADLTQDVKIHLIGDIDGNGKINVGDVSKLNGHIKGSNPLTDDYMILCANVNGGKLNMGDVSTLYAHIKGTKKLY